MSVQSEIERISTNVSDTLTAVSDMGGTVPESATSDDMAASVLTIPKGTSDYNELTNKPITRIESTDDTNLVNLRDLDSGTYVLYGRFKPFSGSDSTMTFSSELLVFVVKKTSASSVQVLYPVNNCVQHVEITDTDYTRTNVYLNDLAAKINGTVTSENADYAEVGEWVDGNPDGEDRIGYFVAVDLDTTGTTMVKANSDSDVRGVTVTAPAFSGGVSADRIDESGNLLSQYDYVAVMGLVPVIDNGTCTINGRCMPSDDGTAVPSTNSMGYQVIDRIDDTHVLIAVEPGADMLSRVKDAVNELSEAIGNKLDASALPTVVNDALAQAKASGEFDGADGKDGADGADGKDGISTTHSWSGTTLTVTSASGTSSADLKGEKGDTGATGAKGDTGAAGPQGPQGIQGEAGPQGEKGDKGATGADGYTPVRGTDYWTTEDQEKIVADVLSSLPNANGVSF